MTILVVAILLLVLLDLATLRFGVSSRDDSPEAIDAESRTRKLLL